MVFGAQVAPDGEQAPETTAEPAAKLDPDSDEIREKFRIVRVRRPIGGESNVLDANPANGTCALHCKILCYARLALYDVRLHSIAHWTWAACWWHSFMCIWNALLAQ